MAAVSETELAVVTGLVMREVVLWTKESGNYGLGERVG